MTFRPRRSVLYMPGSNALALDKARTLNVDALIFDLEDAVDPDAKETARSQVSDAVKQGGYGPREVVIRINGLSTPWGEADLEAAATAGPDAILIPKIFSPDDLTDIEDRLRKAGASDDLALWAMMETPLAMLNAGQIAAAAGTVSPRLSVFVMGTNDLAKETGARLVPGRAAMLPWLMTCLAAARANGLDIVDGVYNDFANEEGFAAECAQGMDMGMNGKTLIHPTQIAPCNETFSASAEEVERARTIIAAFDLPENANKGAIQLDGRMVERLHAEMARRTVVIADAIAARAIETTGSHETLPLHHRSG
ncbi:CoA ester lyase [Breoghania sp.]|uniref:HpcH/HpaI aldolase/citrate lyase family protein n=1 Tax=Breoghania sp. TaxID=2065378 RepID=UPI0026103DB3|nr:CoA ester lyase [Breoghania sp.]MDJ0930632.1 CoA ester lyase [Breoghania sp.]